MLKDEINADNPLVYYDFDLGVERLDQSSRHQDIVEQSKSPAVGIDICLVPVFFQSSFANGYNWLDGYTGTAGVKYALHNLFDAAYSSGIDINLSIAGVFNSTPVVMNPANLLVNKAVVDAGVESLSAINWSNGSGYNFGVDNAINLLASTPANRKKIIVFIFDANYTSADYIPIVNNWCASGQNRKAYGLGLTSTNQTDYNINQTLLQASSVQSAFRIAYAKDIHAYLRDPIGLVPKGDWKLTRSPLPEKLYAANFNDMGHGVYAPNVGVQANLSNALDLDALTVELVFQAKSVSGTQTIGSYAGTDPSRLGWYIKIVNGTLTTYFGTAAGASQYYYTTSYAISAEIVPEKWYHCVVRCGLNGYNIFLNGVRMALKPSGFTRFAGEGLNVGLTLGSSFYGDELAKCYIDTFAIYGGFLNTGRLLAHFAATGFGGPIIMGVGNTSRATVLQGIQVGKEPVPGFGAAATLRLKNMQIQPNADIPVALVRHNGSKAYTGTQVAQESANLSLSGVLDPNTAPLLLDTMYGGAVPTQPSANSYMRVYNPAAAAALPHPDTLAVQSGSNRGAELIKFAFLTGLTMRWTREEASIEGTMVGQKLDRDFTVTSNVPVLAPAAIHPKNVSLFISPDGTNFTRLRKNMSGEINMNGLWAPTYNVSDVNPSFEEIHEMSPDFAFQLTMQEGKEASTFFDRLRDGNMFYIGFRAIGTLIDLGTGIVNPSSAPKLTALTTGGNLPAGTYTVYFSYRTTAGTNTLPSEASTITLTGSTNRIAVNVGSLPVNATGFTMYISNDGGATIAYGMNVSAGSTGIYSNTSSVGSPLPTTNGTGTLSTYEMIQVQMPVRVNTQDQGDEGGVLRNTFHLANADDETFGLTKITVVNRIASYG